jgi:hypothetical protein
MQDKQRVADMAVEVLARQAGLAPNGPENRSKKR